MKLRDVMTNPVIRIHPDETVAVAARTLTHYNIGALPVCGTDGKLCGVLTDRDIVTRCLAANRNPDITSVGDVMTSQVQSVAADADVALAARIMGSKQVRRLPVVESGRLCGMISLGDLAHSEENIFEAADALTEITSNISRR